MHWIDWSILGVYLVWIVWDGLRMTKRSNELEGYFLASRSIPWWAVGLSVPPELLADQRRPWRYCAIRSADRRLSGARLIAHCSV